MNTRSEKNPPANVLVLVNTISETSIPFELSVEMAAQTDLDIHVASFMDQCTTDIDIRNDPNELPLTIHTLGATSRFDQKAWSKFRRKLKHGYDLVHTHHNFSGSVARVLSSIEDVPVINTEHRDHSSLSPLQNAVNAPTLSLADRIISNSQVTQNSFRWYEQLLIDDYQLEVVYNGINIRKIQNIVSNSNDTNDTFVICTAARMVPVKNQSVLIRAFDQVVDQYPNSKLIFLGDGPLKEDLKQLTNNLELTDNVQFRGEVSRNRVYEVFAKSDVFAISSHSEGFCVAAVEAMASGLPVVASDIKIFHEVINSGGLFADQTNPDKFAQALLKIKQGCDYEEISTKAKQRAAKKFSLDKCVKKYYKIYMNVLNKHR
ncbi:glycosyltransferase family 4 protein [Halorubrum ezzemoulense]|uniref:Glycosyltransferase family 4 protein n=1 Tax=Halorubrum ezzemoulense TaxID=337243 RepID=A0ABT4Z5T3_HALEZ|nr:glycosyltransferase family 4 protein [Halorubrum ezzemoulense]MDB2245706.1 glycosyltransferase family 4 protein [Halorubrum ezzemoulense]MDB2279353.1 glycosyltransferase family 4 protein [Halorubrum ezzemoulense]MDB2289877.1 glycosyltransferase family 4 protein [Halorubrum ezzemoulense]MDB2292961.1 glycosyltransferase family 4 protein [Halorubrum ezzemoulense]MDB2297347.1 glycosyltransferase family 4 protein [Halorubrum ezzemoulense]